MYVPRLPPMMTQSSIIIFFLRALLWYSSAFFVSLVARVVYSTALSTWASILNNIVKINRVDIKYSGS